MGYTKLRGAPFTGLEPEPWERENLVAITRGERAKGDAESPWETDPNFPELCLEADPDNHIRTCSRWAGHQPKEAHSWRSITDSA